MIVSAAGTLFIMDGDTAWPLAGYCSLMAAITLAALGVSVKRAEAA